ncbi:MAG: ribosome assembly cofactor RimP [Bacteroidota bacterium]
MISKELVIELATERMNELDNGLFIVELTISASNFIHLEIDKHEGGVSVKDCVSVSRNIEHNLDREEEDFELEVSSAGLDKPLRVLPQFIKNIGRSVEVVLNDGQKTEGLMVAADEQGITLESSKKVTIEGKKKKEVVVEQQVLPFEQIKETKIVITFK